MKLRTVGPSGPHVDGAELGFGLVSNTGSCTRTDMAAMMEPRMSAASNSFL